MERAILADDLPDARPALDELDVEIVIRDKSGNSKKKISLNYWLITYNEECV